MFLFYLFQEIGMVHIRIVEGLNSLLQLSALLAKLCTVAAITGN